MHLLEIRHIFIECEIDKDDEVLMTAEEESYINKWEAEQIIDHLSEVFSLGIYAPEPPHKESPITSPLDDETPGNVSGALLKKPLEFHPIFPADKEVKHCDIMDKAMATAIGILAPIEEDEVIGLINSDLETPENE